MKNNAARKQSGQIIAAESGGLVIFMAIFGLLFVMLFNMTLMLIYTQRLAFLAADASYVNAFSPTTSITAKTSTSTMITDLHLPTGTTVTNNGPSAANSAVLYTVTASYKYPFWGSGILTALGITLPAVTLTDTEGSMAPPYL